MILIEISRAEWSRLWICLPYFCANKHPKSLSVTPRKDTSTWDRNPRHQTTRSKKKESFFIRRNGNRNILWVDGILSSALRQKSRVLPNKPFIQNAVVSKSNNNPLMFVLVTVLRNPYVTCHRFINRDPFNSSWNNYTPRIISWFFFEAIKRFPG